MAKVIVGVDGSKTAAAAAERAAGLATSMGAELIVVSAFQGTDDVQVGDPGSPVALPPSDVALKIAGQAIDALKPEFPGLAATPHSGYGKPADVLVDAAAEFDASIIVVGNKRVQGVAHVLGSIASDVARHASCDVYIAHTH
jgi:nucleotide-binding universal stress UspA family protein